MSRSRWWFPDTGIESSHISHAREFVDGLDYRDRVVAVLVAGSRAAGLAHARSDLDLIVVLAAGEDCGSRRTLPARHRGLTVDTDVLEVGDVQRHLDAQRIREAAEVLDRSLYALPSYVVWSTLVRLVTGHVVMATPAAGALLGSLERDAVRRSAMVHDTLCLATFAEDAKGSVECGDLATALAASEEAVRYAAEVGLTALDDLYVGRKYLLRRMARHESLAVLLESGNPLGQPGSSAGDDEVTELVRRRLLLAGHLVGHALTTAWKHPVAAFPPFTLKDEGPVRDPYLVPVRWPGGMALMTGVDVVRTLSEVEAVLWNLLDGHSVRDIVGRFAERTCRDISSAGTYVREVIGEWSRIGIVHGMHAARR
jgi:predicted nucleotidyltransferase